MPCKSFACEFCKIEFRKDALAVHIKAKHTKEMALYLLSELKENSISAINSYCKNTKHNPIHSTLHDGGVYIFGVKPQFFPEDKDSNDIIHYIKSEDNLKAHAEYVEEILENISLLDYIKQQREVIIRSEEMTKKNDTLKQLHTEIEHLKLQRESANKIIQTLEEKVADYESYYDTKDTIVDIKNNNAYLQKKVLTLEDRLRIVNEQIDSKETAQVETTTRIRTQYIKEVEYFQEQVAQYKKVADTLTKENEKLKTRVKAEAEKLMEKEKERKKKAKKQLKKAKALAKLAESDSDSSSDSD